MAGRIEEVHYNRVRPMPGQPRRYFDPDELRELAVRNCEGIHLWPRLQVVAVIPDDDGLDEDMGDAEASGHHVATAARFQVLVAVQM